MLCIIHVVLQCVVWVLFCPSISRLAKVRSGLVWDTPCKSAFVVALLLLALMLQITPLLYARIVPNVSCPASNIMNVMMKTFCTS